VQGSGCVSRGVVREIVEGRSDQPEGVPGAGRLLNAIGTAGRRKLSARRECRSDGAVTDAGLSAGRTVTP